MLILFWNWVKKEKVTSMKLRMRYTFAIVVLIISGFTLGTKNVQAVETNQYGIVIDGKFDDWEGKPKTDIYFSYNNGNVTKQGSFLSDGKYLYIYIDMDPYKKGHNYRFQGSGWYLSVGDSRYSLRFILENNKSNVALGTIAKISGVATWPENDPQQIFVQQWTIPDIIGYVKADSIPNSGKIRDRAEIRIPLAGIFNNPDIVKEMTISNNNLGEQKITVTGGSTGGVVIVVSGFMIASAVVYRNTKKKKRASL